MLLSKITIVSIVLTSLNGLGANFEHLFGIYFSACKVGFVIGFAYTHFRVGGGKIHLHCIA
jgi:hypothetical protein